MEKSTIKGKRSDRWRWLFAVLVVVFFAVAASSKIRFSFNDLINSFRFSHQESDIKGTQPFRLWRERPPTTYGIKFESFTTTMDLVKDGYYESDPFTVGGFNWTFLIYPKGNKEATIYEYVSLYARIDNSSLIADSQEVYAEVKLFVYNHKFNLYYYYLESEPMRFHLFKPMWGVAEFLPTSYFKVPALGYITEGGESVFGIDVFIAKPLKNWEVVSYYQNIINPIFTWNLTNFSTLNLDSYTSDPFSSRGRNWVLKVYPNGDGVGTGNSLSLYLLSDESNEKDYVRAKLRVLNKILSNHMEKQVEGWPNAAENGWGFEKFIPLSDLKDGTKGFVVGDLLEVEVEIMAFSKTDSI